jgi:hypothetical protein
MGPIQPKLPELIGNITDPTQIQPNLYGQISEKAA